MIVSHRSEYNIKMPIFLLYLKEKYDKMTVYIQILVFFEVYMLTCAYSAGLFGIDGYLVTVECNAYSELPQFEIVGLPDAAVKEAKQRVQAAIINSGYLFPETAMTVNLAPADVKKEGSAFDLAILATLLKVSTSIPPMTDLENCCFIGELSFSGALRSVRGTLPMVLSAKAAGKTEIFVPAANAAEASVVDGVNIYGCETVSDMVGHLRGEAPIVPAVRNIGDLSSRYDTDLDFADVKGQERAKRALEIAAAGGHNVLLIGPPGAGKSMLSKRIPTILPPMTPEEALETTKIHSVSGFLKEGQSLVTRRPFRSPHHTLSAPALVGGGKTPTPGEISIAHNGVLFLDELPEFAKNVSESLRQPLEDGKITVTRTAGRVTFPSDFMLVCAMNPCKCGYFGSKLRECTCKKTDIKKYLQKISGPLLDRIDIQVELPALEYSELSKKGTAEPSAAIRERVIKARKIAEKRFEGTALACNAAMASSHIRRFCALDEAGDRILKNAFEAMGMSARGYDRILRVARTIADLDDAENISARHIAEAVQLRSLDRKYW